MKTVRMMYQCGRCGNTQVREYESRDDLIVLETVYCGKCATGRHLTLMSSLIIEVKVETDKGPEVQGPERRSYVLANGEGAATTGKPAEGRVDSDKADNIHLEPEAGKRSAERLPPPPAGKAKVDGRQAK